MDLKGKGSGGGARVDLEFITARSSGWGSDPPTSSRSERRLQAPERIWRRPALEKNGSWWRSLRLAWAGGVVGGGAGRDGGVGGGRPAGSGKGGGWPAVGGGGLPSCPLLASPPLDRHASPPAPAVSEGGEAAAALAGPACHRAVAPPLLPRQL
uniref:Uncharacterized protein n=1 Tax=Oryza sativa subsp. japonica TaxID=39947 RepID=Q6ZCE8_ORYSJ|nr:hypothetical protein [Oryza sativa Japonica Group]BAD11551.1 hypothetical protein [Oryza sativa Japonica Group]